MFTLSVGVFVRVVMADTSMGGTLLRGGEGGEEGGEESGGEGGEEEGEEGGEEEGEEGGEEGGEEAVPMKRRFPTSLQTINLSATLSTMKMLQELSCSARYQVILTLTWLC